MEICTHLGNVDLGNLQKELRSALSDLNVTPNVNSDNWDIRDAIASLLTPSETVLSVATSTTSTSMIASAGTDQDLDRTLSGLIPNYKELSSEVKRACRPLRRKKRAHKARRALLLRSQAIVLE